MRVVTAAIVVNRIMPSIICMSISTTYSYTHVLYARGSGLLKGVIAHIIFLGKR